MVLNSEKRVGATSEGLVLGARVSLDRFDWRFRSRRLRSPLPRARYSLFRTPLREGLGNCRGTTEVANTPRCFREY
jgi:hypothetical protein